MRLLGGALLTAGAAVMFLLSAAGTGLADSPEGQARKQPRVITDGRLRVGHLETIRLKRFPGKGVADISFFPTAICEDGCGARTLRRARTDARGAATFQVRVPGTFLDHRNHPVYLRDGERIHVEVTWEGPGRSFAGARAEPEPILVRSHGAGGPAMASSRAPREAAPEGPLPVPGSFRLQGSNGYVFSVLAEPARASQPASLLIALAAKGQSVTYSAPATVTETSMQASLGALGEIAVTFQRSNQPTSVPCGKRAISFDSGSYVGTIDFRGEEGFTNVEATSVPGNIDFMRGLFCGGAFSAFFGGPERGGELSVRNPALGPRMSVRNSRPGATAQISASSLEYSNGISIERSTSLRMPGADFTYGRDLRTATVRPPAPFAGSAQFDLGRKAGKRWSGDLTVDLPGKADVPLTGGALRASLTRSE